MKFNARLSVLLATASLLATGLATSANAASVMTDAFVANVRPNVDFLDRSSRMALDKSPSAAVRGFAHQEALEQTITANALVAWSQTNGTTDVAVVDRPVDAAIGAVDTLVTVPLDTAATVTRDVTTGVGGVVTGRSVAIDTPLTVTPAPRTAAPLLPSDQTDLARLSDASGRTFDALYKNTQRNSLRQLATLYTDYVHNGDDPALQAMAARELPKINRRIAELMRL